MKWFFVFLSLSFPLLAPAADVSLPENVKSVCVLVRSTIGSPDGRSPFGMGTGTGFFVAPDLVLTANHLANIPMGPNVMPADTVEVETRRGHFVSARIVGRDTDHDLLLLKVSEPLAGKPLKISDFSLDRGDKVAIIGNFPEAVRVTRGEMMARNVMEGFAMSSAKVRSGFSGGPILCEDGSCQGILSQRDDANNSIFVRSDVVKRLIRSYERRSGRTVLAPDQEKSVQEEATAPSGDKAPSKGSSPFVRPAPKQRKQTSALSTDGARYEPAIDALPVRANP